MDRLRAAVVGFGAMGKNHVRACQNRDDMELVAIVEPATSTVPRSPNVSILSSVDELIATQKLDVVIVATPSPTHLEIGLKLLRAGMPTLIEKPLATSVADAERLVSTARQQKTLLMVGHVERHNPAVQLAKREIDAGRLGKVVSISARRLGMAPPVHRDGNNVVIDMAVHDLDIISWLFGRAPSGLVARTGCASGVAADYVEILLDFEGASASIQANWLTPCRIRKLYITGTEGYAELDYIQQTLQLSRKMLFTGSATYEELHRMAQRSDTAELVIKKREPLHCQLDNLVASVRDPDLAIATGDVGLSAVVLAELALRSSRSSLPENGASL